MTTRQNNYSIIGNVGNVALGLSTILLTICKVYHHQLHSKSSMFDEKWLENGICISNEETFWWNSHSLSFFTAMIYTAVLKYMSAIQQEQVPSLQKAILSGAIHSVFGHGLAHLYFAMDPAEMDLRFDHDKLSQSLAVTTVALFTFGSVLTGLLPFASRKKIISLATLITLGFTILDVEPKHNFAYIEAALYAMNSIHMLWLSREHKHTATYALYPFFHFLVLAAGILESCGCEALLQGLGGHVVYDSVIAGAYIMIELSSNYLESSTKKLKLS